MSHVVQMPVTIGTDQLSLDAIKAVCKELGLIFKQGQKTYRWYGASVGDSPLPAGIDKSQLGTCDHAIEVPGAQYDIGLTRTKDGKSYAVLFDFWGPGAPILEKLQIKLDNKGQVKDSKFSQIYAVTKTELAMRKLGHTTTRQHLKNGSINVLITGARL